MICQIKRFFWTFLILLFLASCGSRSLDEFQEEGEGLIRSLIQELQTIHSREKLLASSGKLQKYFERLVNIMIAAEEFSYSHPELEKGESIRHDLSDQLRIELNRLYRLEGGRQIIEKCQEKALHRLDAFEKKDSKQNRIGS